ncbi:type I phosphomannose isomerase catalytic subunit [Clostridium rectalis]|uniref:type I phosphomannose isomerase catalytic subunit n=1 Tax=Clostridium rectalis TaxID=2040295 RepID=UPI0013DD94A3|nr:type I phosphomannose isomerase catalytic subunit [Clostridium rectalis]
MFYPFKFDPLCKKALWGEEKWKVSTHPKGLSIILNGFYKGYSLYMLINKYREEILGTNFSLNEEFPLLIKYINALDKLSIQVHPDDYYAYKNENKQMGKNELWYILYAEPNAKLICGTKENVNKEKLLKEIYKDNIKECVNYIKVKPGDIINIPAGTVHSIGGGIKLLEVQQNSDLTYRLYDYHRKDSQGNERELHIKKALQVINFENDESGWRSGLKFEISKGLYITYIALSRRFCIEMYQGCGQITENTYKKAFVIYIILQGEGRIIYNFNIIKFTKGEAIFVPASLEKHMLQGKFKFLKIYMPYDDIIDKKVEKLMDMGYSRAEIFKMVVM